jgi:hypothetical protein
MTSKIDVSGRDILDRSGRALALSFRLLLKSKLRPVDVFSDRLKDGCDMNSKKPSRQIGSAGRVFANSSHSRTILSV